MTEHNQATVPQNDRSLHWGDNMPYNEGQELTDLYQEGWAVVIGINDYGSRHSRLANAVNDAQAVAKLLKNAYNFQHVVTLCDEQATQEAILNWLEDELPKQAKPDDRVVFFFAGHGTTRQGVQGQTRGYLIPQDAASGQYSDYIDMTRLKDACGWISAKHILLILDCCFAGVAAVTPRSEPPSLRPPLNKSYLKTITQKRAWQVLTAGASDERAADSGSRPGHSAFTSMLLAGLLEDQADLNRDGIITASELAGYLRPKVSEDSSRDGGKGQTPFFNYLTGSEEGDFVFLRPGQKVTLQPEGVLEQEIKPLLRQNPWIWGVLIVVILILLLGGGGLFAQRLADIATATAQISAVIATATAQRSADFATATAQRSADFAMATAAAMAQQTAQAGATAIATTGGSAQEQQVALANVLDTQATATVAAATAVSDLSTPEPPTVIPTHTFTSVFTPTFTPRVPTATLTPQPPMATPYALQVSDKLWMDRTEVTNAQYNQCVETTVCSTPESGYGEIFEQDDHPVVGVNWWQADIYCREWKKGRLPTISEWQAAASPNGWPWPWGSNENPSCTRAVISGCTHKGEHTESVGSLPSGANPQGIVDLIGNVWEWTADIQPGTEKPVVLGGSWSNPDNTPQGGFTYFNPIGNNPQYLSQGKERQQQNQGFRCVYDQEPQ